MQVITMEAEAFQMLIRKIDTFQKDVMNLVKKESNPLNEKWLNTEEVCKILKVSRRTLQNYRDNGLIPFSQISGKIYYRASDIDKILQENYFSRQDPEKLLKPHLKSHDL